jgi:two-component system chemotaxis response regulator CheY
MIAAQRSERRTNLQSEYLMLQCWLPALVVDDCRTAAAIMKKMLLDFGFKAVERHHSAADAWEALHLNKYSLILSDIDMAPVSGLELLDAVRADKDIWTTPIILATASPSLAFECTSARCRVGPTAVIIKPFTAKALRRKLAETMEAAFPKEELLPSHSARLYDEWAPSEKHELWESTLRTRLTRLQLN